MTNLGCLDLPSTSSGGLAASSSTSANSKDKYSGYSDTRRECYRCREKVNLTKDCKSRTGIKCFNCDEIGHISTNCSKPKSIPKADVNLIVPRENETSFKKYEKNVKIGNIEFIAFVDPGSSDCFIKESVMLANGFKFTDMSNKIEGFGGGETEFAGIIRENLTVDNCEVKQIRFRVVRDSDQRNDVIIGRNYTDLPQLAFCRYDDKFEFMSRDIFSFKTYPEIESREEGLERPIVAETVNLPPATINFIKVTKHIYLLIILVELTCCSRRKP